MTHRSTILVLILALFSVQLGVRAEDPSPSKNKRLLYMVKSGNAKELAGLLGKHFKGDAEIDILNDAENCLLISAIPTVRASPPSGEWSKEWT